jgi:hypothetical protein
MAKFRFGSDGNVFADDVDVKRASRAARKIFASPDFKLPVTPDEHLDFVSRLFGGQHFHELRALSKEGVPVPPAGMEPLSLFSLGQGFPRGLPPRFNKAWQEKLVGMIQDVLAAGINRPEYNDVFALVGGKDSGKTITCRHMAHVLGGFVIDAAFFNVAYVVRPSWPKSRGLIAYDSGASHMQRLFEFQASKFGGAFEAPTSPSDANLDAVFATMADEKVFNAFNLIALTPADPLRSPFHGSNKDGVVIATFSSADAAIEQCFRVFRPGFLGQPPKRTVDLLHAIDLDAMTLQQVPAPAFSKA